MSVYHLSNYLSKQAYGIDLATWWRRGWCGEYLKANPNHCGLDHRSEHVETWDGLGEGGEYLFVTEEGRRCWDRVVFCCVLLCCVVLCPLPKRLESWCGDNCYSHVTRIRYLRDKYLLHLRSRHTSISQPRETRCCSRFTMVWSRAGNPLALFGPHEGTCSHFGQPFAHHIRKGEKAFSRLDKKRQC